MYQGYRINIDGTVLPNTYISKGSYSSSKTDRLIDSYIDSLQVTHDIISSNKRMIITFTLREHQLKEHQNFTWFLKKRENVQVAYWDEDKMDYSVGKFKIDAPEWSHAYADAKNIKYNALNVKLTEY